MKFANTLSMGLMLATLATGCNQPASEPKATPPQATPAPSTPPLKNMRPTVQAPTAE